MADAERFDLEAIINLIPAGVRALDLGCGDGGLLQCLAEERQVEARGVELSEANVRAAVTRGVSVRHGDIEQGLADYTDGAFDYVVLSQTLAYLNRPEPVVKEMLRVGRHAVVSFDNAGHWRRRGRALRGGGMGPTLVSGEPRARAITLRQFEDFASRIGAKIEHAVFLSGRRRVRVLPSLFATVAVYVLVKAGR